MTASVFDDEQFTTIYRDHHGWLVRLLWKKLDSRERAADLAHETFLRVLATRGKEAPREPCAFLTSIAKGLLVDHYRRRELEQAYLQALAAQPERHAPSPETRLLVIDALVRVDRVLAALPDKTRTIFLLSQIEGLSHVAIAARTGYALITVKRHMLAAFRACLDIA